MENINKNQYESYNNTPIENVIQQYRILFLDLICF